MVKTKLLSFILCFVLLICLVCTLACCVDGQIDVENRRYDMAVMIARREKYQTEPTEERWIVPIDKNYIYIEQEYDGKYYDYFVYAYNFPKHPDFGEVWFLHDGFYLAKFTYNHYTKEGPSGSVSEYSHICEKGEYKTTIYASDTSQLWKPKHINLRITIK